MKAHARGLVRLVALETIRREPDELIFPGQQFLATPREAEQLCAFGRARLTPQAEAILGASPWVQPVTR